MNITLENITLEKKYPHLAQCEHSYRCGLFISKELSDAAQRERELMDAELDAEDIFDQSSHCPPVEQAEGAIRYSRREAK